MGAEKNKVVRERFYYQTDQIIDKMFNWKQMARLFHYLHPYRKNLLPLSFLMVIITTVIRLAIPILIGVYTLDHAVKDKNSTLLMQLVMIIFSLYVLSYAANIYRIKWMNQLGQHVIYDLRKHLFTHVQGLSHRFFDTRSGGSILVRIMNDINSLQDLFTNGVVNLFMDLLLLAGIVVILFSLSPTLTCAVLVILPIMFFISTKLRRRIRRSWQVVRMKQSVLNSHLNESIQGIRVTQSFAQEQENMLFFERINSENYESWRQATRKNAMFRPFVELTNAVGTAILIWFGAVLIQDERLTIGIFVSFAFYLGMFWEPISRLGQVYNQLLMGMASSERIFEFLDEKPLVTDLETATPLENIKGKIEFNHVSFSYDGRRNALDNISIKIKEGQTVALVGHTGSGKTSIANLITRFYNVNEGHILIDNKLIQNITLASLRAQISIVLQETFIFSGTIMENIRFGKPDSTDDEVIKAAEAVGAADFIKRLKNGYDTEVEERGNVLSVGERQLISFARTLLANPRIIILDEATASIDTETEVKIQQALKMLLQDRTAIMIAHRLSTIREADNIIVLDHGSIIETGNHVELMQQKGVYYDLVQTHATA